MSESVKIIVEKQRTVHTYAELWHASECVLSVGIQNPIGSSWQFLSSIVLTAFTFEAYLNHVGAATFECWDDLDKLSPWSKLELLCERFTVAFPQVKGARPLQTVANVLDFRNTIAHGKSEELKVKPVHRTTENYHAAYMERPLALWESLIQTEEFAIRAREDVEVVLQALHDARPGEKEGLFTFGMALYSAGVLPTP